MSLYNIDENKNMVLDALFAPYSDSPRDVTSGTGDTGDNPISLGVTDWIDVYGDYSLQGEDSPVIYCYMVYAGVYLVIKHHYNGAENGSINLGSVFPSFISSIYVDSTAYQHARNALHLTASAYAGNSSNDWRWYNITYFRIIRLS